MTSAGLVAPHLSHDTLLGLALALGPLPSGVLPAPPERQRCFDTAWGRREAFPRWRGARRPSDLLARMERLLAGLSARGDAWLFAGEPHYPAALSALPRPPAVLFYRGVRPPSLERCVAIVGSRAAFRAELELARELAETVARADWIVVSGGALGIDTAAHEGALAAGARTIAVLGNGLDRPYPSRNARLFEAIAERGWLLTPFAPDESPVRWHFPARNGLLAALARTVVVVAAAEHSGALDTARKARSLGRPLAAVPRSAGCRALIASGQAAAVHQGQGLLALLEGRGLPHRVLDPELQQLVEVLATAPVRGIDALAAQLRIGVPRAAMLLLRAELAGAVSHEPGGFYRALGVAGHVRREAGSGTDGTDQ